MPQKKLDFVHLHTHSEYSLLDGASRITDLVTCAKDLGMKSIGLTDHGNMYAAVNFYKTAREQGIKPIIGCEMYVARRSRLDKETKEDRSPYHLTLLARNLDGYKNLLKLVGISNLEGFYSKPRIDKDILPQYSKGLIALSGCSSGEISWNVLNNDIDKAKQVARFYKDLFGVDFYIEMMNQNIPGQKELNRTLADIGLELGIDIVATNDNHYTRKVDANAQDVMLCIQTARFVDEKNRMRFPTQEFYIKSAKEMAQAFDGMENAITNSLDIADKCDLELELGKLHLPDFPVPDNMTADSYLEELCADGLKERFGLDIKEQINQRLKFELETIEKTKFAPYFLIVHDFVKFAKKSGIQVGPGRGSAAGSIVSYVLGITNVNPIKYDLIFERFLNPDRISMPDIDIDFCYERRGEVIDYVTKKYGSDHVAQIITFGTMAARAVIRDVGRVLRIPLADVDKIAKLVPFGPDVTIDTAIQTNTEFKHIYESEEKIKYLIDTAKTLEGLVRHASVHAAGVVISQKPLAEYVPLQLMNETQVVTQYPMTDLEKIGLLKMDFLGLRNLTMIAYAVSIINIIYGTELDMNNIPLDDEKTFKLLNDGETIGVFQLESRGMRALIKDLKPDRFEDIVALLALYRPGPLESGMVEDFIKRKNGSFPIQYSMPQLETILKETYGVILYQEQVMRIASDIAGFTLSQADVLRAAMGKKKEKEMARLKSLFIDGAVGRGIAEKKAKELFELCSKFAGYGFNKSHSTAYSFISYQTAYLKANYPVEFMAALLTSVMGVTEKVTLYISECRKMDIAVTSPDINESFKDFTVVRSSIRFGLAAIKNVGIGAIESIISARHADGHFTSLSNFCSRVDLRLNNKRVIESLIKAGAFDSLKLSRATLLKNVAKILEKSAGSDKQNKSGQTMLFKIEDTKTGDDFAPEEEFSREQLLHMEKEMLGLYISDNPLLHLEAALDAKTNIKIGEIDEKKEGSVVLIGGMISAGKKITTRKNELMLVCNIDDLSGSIGLVVFPRSYEKYSSLLKDDEVVIIKGRVDNRNDELKIICEEVETLKPAIGGKSFHVGVPAIEPITFVKLKDIFCDNRGTSPVYLHVDSSVVEVGKGFFVNISPVLISQVEKVVGDGSTWIEFFK